MKRFLRIGSLLGLLTMMIVLMPTRPMSPVIPEPPPDRKLTVMCYYENPDRRALVESLCAGFSEDYPGVEAQVVFMPYESYAKRLLLHYSQSSIQDLLIVENADMPAFIKLGLLEDITSFVENRVSGEDFYLPPLRAGIMEDGRYYGLPFTCTSYALYCNMDVLDSLGLSPPKTWEELKYMAKRIPMSGAQGFGICARKTEQGMGQFMQFFASTGGAFSALDGTDGMRAFALLDYMMRDGTLVPGSLTWSEDDLRLQFERGNISMMLNTSSQIPLLRQQEGLNWIAVPPPIDKKQAAVLSGENIGVTKGRFSRDALSFLEYVSDEAQVREMSEAFGSIPVRADVLLEMRGIDPQMDLLFYDRMDIAQFKGAYSSWLEISEAVTDNVFELLTQTKSPTQAGRDARVLVNDYIIYG